MIVVTGATGHIGTSLIDQLVARGQQVRAIARGAGKLAGKKGVEVRAGDLTDAAFLADAFAGAEAVFTMIPPNMALATLADVRRYQNEVGESITRALAAAKPAIVADLSSVGADLAEGSGVVQGLHDQEQRLDRVLPLTSVVHLRAGYFMENTVNLAGVIKGMGVLASPLRGDLPIGMVATRDIAAAAADELTGVPWQGHRVRYLLGPRDVTYAEVAALIAKAIGRPVPYVQAPYDQVRAAMTGMGMGAGVVDGLIELTRSMNEGRITAPRTAGATTPTGYETFVTEVFAPAFRAA